MHAGPSIVKEADGFSRCGNYVNSLKLVRDENVGVFGGSEGCQGSSESVYVDLDLTTSHGAT